MCENVKLSCSCDEGYDKGVLKKSLENNIFTVFGNLTEENSIVIRYHGLLTENENNSEFKINYCFDTPENEKKSITLTKCTKCTGINYCTTIDLEKHTKIYFKFADSNGLYEQNGNKLFELEIKKDPISSIMQRYGFEENNHLPISQETSYKKLNCIKSIFEFVRSIFSKVSC